MTHRYAIYVDAGYLLAAGQWACSGTFLSRNQYDADLAMLVRVLKERAESQLPDRELLRLYWYDAALARLPTAEQVGVSYEDDVALRVGLLTNKGEQKGVDALVILDMYDHALTGAVNDAILVAGDGDLAEGVTRAQMRGVRVSVWSFDTPQTTVSPELARVADRHQFLPIGGFKDAFRPVRPAPSVTPWSTEDTIETEEVHDDTGAMRQDEGLSTFAPTESTMEGAREAATQFAAKIKLRWTPAQVSELLSAEPRVVPREIDKQLIGAVLNHLRVDRGTVLSTETVYAMREAFFDALA